MSDAVSRADAARAHGAVRRRSPRERAVALARTHRWAVVVWATLLGWAVTLCAITFERYQSFQLFGYDMGNMVQAVWSTADGRPLEVTNGPTGEQLVRLGLHVDPILAALAPLWLVAPSPLMLVTVQIGAVALGALPVFWLGRRHLGSARAGAIAAIVYLAYPWTAWAAVDVFHSVVLATPLFLFAIWFLDDDRLGLFAVCAILAAATGELMGLAVACLGLWYALARRRRLAGLAIAGAGAAWTAVAVYVVVPFFSGGQSVYYGAFEHVGGSPRGVVRTLFTDPAAILGAMTSDNDLIYAVALAAPLGGAFLLAPGLAAVALPQLGVNVLSGLEATTSPHLHYVAAVVPFLVAATVLGLARLSPERRVAGVFVVCALSLAAAVAAGSWPGPFGGRPAWWERDVPAARAEALRRAVALVPPGEPVTSTGHVRPRLAEREYIASVPVLGRAEWIVLDEADHWVPRAFGGTSDPAAVHAFRARVERSGEWQLVFEQHGVFVFRKERG